MEQNCTELVWGSTSITSVAMQEILWILCSIVVILFHFGQVGYPAAELLHLCTCASTRRPGRIAWWDLGEGELLYLLTTCKALILTCHNTIFWRHILRKAKWCCEVQRRFTKLGQRMDKNLYPFANFVLFFVSACLSQYTKPRTLQAVSMCTSLFSTVAFLCPFVPYHPNFSLLPPYLGLSPHKVLFPLFFSVPFPSPFLTLAPLSPSLVPLLFEDRSPYFLLAVF